MRETVDLSDPASFENGVPYDFFAHLREANPVSWNEVAPDSPVGTGFWSVTRHEDIKHVSRTPAVFSSADGTTMADAPEDNLPMMREMLIMTDPPHHHAYRKMVSGYFTPRSIGELEKRIRKAARNIVYSLEDGQVVDFVRVIATPMPNIMISELMGIPDEERIKVGDWSNELVRYANDMEKPRLRRCHARDVALRERTC